MKRNKDQASYFLSRAAQTAMNGIRQHAGGPFGAVIVKNRLILAKAHNTVLRTKDPTCHAEINALRKASRRQKTPFLTGCVVYTTTEPCPMCLSALHWARVWKVVYSTSIADVRKLGFNELTISSRRMIQMGKSRLKLNQVANEECRHLLEAWKKLPRKKTY